MRRYALPLGVLAVTILLVVLIALGSAGAPDYSGGVASPQPISAEWARGNLASNVVVMEYSDFQCPACVAYEPVIEQLTSEYQDRVAFVYRHFPLIQIHPNADLAARASEAAGKQGKFWQMHDVLFAKHDAWESMVNAEAAFTQYAQEIGLDVAQFKADIDSSEIKQAVADDYAHGMRDGVQGTPTVYLNGAVVEARGYADLKAAIEAALGK